MDSQLPRSTPEMQEIASSALLEFVETVEQQIHELHSFMLVRHGSVVAEGWWSPYNPESPHMMYSLSKSFTSSAIGLAVAEGRLSVEDQVISFFPDDLPAQVSSNLAAMRVRDLLTMSTGHAEDTVDYLRGSQERNWIKAFLVQPVVYQPGTHFVYNSGATYMLSAIIQKLTGIMLLDYLQPRLLQPLGIENATWEVSPQGIHTGGWGLKIKTEDIARFGQMYLQKGVWNGKRILSEAWVEQATSRQIANGTQPESDWEQGYGYQFWRCRHNIYRGDGAFGQYCIVMPEQDAVLAMTSAVPDRQFKGGMQSVLDLIWDCLLPALGNAPLAADAAGHEVLSRKLSSLALLPPQGNDSSPVAAQVSGRTYKAESNQFDFQTISFEFSESQAAVTFTTSSGERRLVCGYGDWRRGERTPVDISPSHLVVAESPIVASGIWTAEDSFTITVRLYETPFYQTLTFHFNGDQLIMETTVNVTFLPQDYTVTARLA